MKKNSCLLIGFGMLLLSGCVIFSWGVPGSGDIVTETRQVDSFTKLEVSGIANVDVSVGEPLSIEVRTDDNLQELVVAEVRNGTLTIKNLQAIRPTDGVNIAITVPSLTAASASGATDVSITGIDVDLVNLWVSGASDLSATGTAETLECHTSGASEADVQGLRAKHVTVNSSGASEAKVHASESLTATASGASDIICYGQPETVDRSASGAADITIRK